MDFKYLDVYKLHEPPEGYRCNYRHVHLDTRLVFDAFPTLARSLLVSVVREPTAHAWSVVRNTEHFCGFSFNETRYAVSQGATNDLDPDDLVALSQRCPKLLQNGAFKYLNFQGQLETPEALADYYDALLVLETLQESLIVLLRASFYPDLDLCDLRWTPQNMNPSRTPRTAEQNRTKLRSERLWKAETSPLDVRLYKAATKKLSRAIATHDRKATQESRPDAAALRALLRDCPESGRAR